MSSSQAFLILLLAFIIGLISSLSLSPLWLVPGFFIIVALAVYKREVVWIFAFVALALGFLRGYSVVLSIKSSPLLQLNDLPQKVTLTGTIVKEPERKENYQRFVFQPQNITGKILVYTRNDLQFLKSQQVEIKGQLKTPPRFEEFDWQAYLAKKGILSVMYYPEISVKKEASFFWRTIFRIKNKAREAAVKYLPKPESYLFRAIILGDKKELPDNLKESLNKAGIRHITAISGMHIMILMNILMSFFLSIGLWRKQASLATILFILFYLFFVGFQPSIVRASIMGCGIILAQMLGRIPDSIRFLLFAASLMLCINPLVFYDVGFQLSFLAALGINYLAPFFYKKLQFLPKSLSIRSIFSFSLSVQVFTLPLLLFYFSYFPFISIFANLLILPILPFILGLGFLATLLSLFLPFLSLPIFFPLSLLLAYILLVANIFAKASFLGINFQLPLWVLILYYSLLTLLVRKVLQKERYWFLEY